MSPALRPVCFLSDFGYGDEFAGVCRAVIHRVDPGLRTIDITHGIPPGDITRGALALADFVPFSPPAVLLAVVDPGVGTDRRAVALAAGEHHLVGPDNGLLLPAAETLGGVSRAVTIDPADEAGEGGPRTFDGRDLFAPAAARLARGDDLAGLGPELDPARLVRPDLPRPEPAADSLGLTVLFRDRFGNVAFNLDRAGLARTFLAEATRAELTPAGGEPLELPVVTAFGAAAAGEPLLFTDANGRLSLAVNRGDAAARFRLAAGDRVTVRRAGS